MPTDEFNSMREPEMRENTPFAFAQAMFRSQAPAPAFGPTRETGFNDFDYLNGLAQAVATLQQANLTPSDFRADPSTVELGAT